MTELTLILILISVSLAAYRPSERGEFVFDDLLVIEHVRAIAKRGSDVSLKEFVTLWRKAGRGLLWFTYKRDAQYHQYNPAGWHATNLGIHAINIALAFAAFRYFFDQPAALAGAAVLAVSPLATQSVSPISGRSSLLCMSFCLLALIFVLTGNLIPAIFAVYLGSKAKEEIVPFVLSLAIVWWWI